MHKFLGLISTKTGFKLFCNTEENNRCITHNNDDVFYMDDDHLSVKGSEMLNKLILKHTLSICCPCLQFLAKTRPFAQNRADETCFGRKGPDVLGNYRKFPNDCF